MREHEVLGVEKRQALENMSPCSGFGTGLQIVADDSVPFGLEFVCSQSNGHFVILRTAAEGNQSVSRHGGVEGKGGGGQ